MILEGALKYPISELLLIFPTTTLDRTKQIRCLKFIEDFPCIFFLNWVVDVDKTVFLLGELKLTHSPFYFLFFSENWVLITA